MATLASKDYFEWSPGTISHLLLFAMSKSKKGSASISLGYVLFLFAFEHTNFHIPLGKHLEVVPYASLWRIRYHWEKDFAYSSTTFQTSCLGAKFRMRLTDRSFMSPFGE